MSFALNLDKDLCIGCGICSESCAFGAITMSDFPEINEDSCRLCGSCVQACAAGALKINKEQPKDSAADNSKGIWVWAEVENGQLAPVSIELLGKAVELSENLAQPVEAVLIGDGVSGLADDLVAYGADSVHVVDSPLMADFIDENYTKVFERLIRQNRPAILLMGATLLGRGLSARLASVLHTGLTADCTELEIDKETKLLRQIRPAFGGNLMATIINPAHRPQMASVRPGIMRPAVKDGSRRGRVVRYDCDESMNDARVRLIETLSSEVKHSSLSNSKIIVAIGRGVKTRKCADEISAWAKSIGASVAGSRAAVEMGLVDASVQVGQTGHTVAPDLYVAIGISGQIQHTAGIVGAKKIMAINTDRQAPIFSVADYGWNISAEEALARLVDITSVKA